MIQRQTSSPVNYIRTASPELSFDFGGDYRNGQDSSHDKHAPSPGSLRMGANSTPHVTDDKSKWIQGYEDQQIGDVDNFGVYKV